MWGAAQGSSSPARLVGWQEGRKPTARPRCLPSPLLRPGSCILQPPLWPPYTPACPPGCHALPLGTGSLLGTASSPALLKVPAAPAPCFLRPSPCNANPFLPCAHLVSDGVLTRGLWGRNTYSDVGLAPGKPLPAYSRLFLPFCCSSLGGRGGQTPRLSDLEPRAQPLWLLPCPGMVLCQPRPQPCTEMRTHTRAYLHRHAHSPAAQETCREPSPLGIKVQPSGHGPPDSGDNEPGDCKPRRRRKSLKTFSLTPATFRGIWHWRVSAISLSGPMSTSPPAPAPPATCPLAPRGGCPSLTGPRPHRARVPPQDAKAGLPQDSLFSHSFIEPFTYPLTHSLDKHFFITAMCQALF